MHTTHHCGCTFIILQKANHHVPNIFPSVGYTRQPPNLDNTPNVLSSCVLCSCTGRSQECFPENGTCYNCRMGSEGEHCERCQPGVDNTTDCRRCIPGFFGLTPSSGGCRGNNIIIYIMVYTLEKPFILMKSHINNSYCLYFKLKLKLQNIRSASFLRKPGQKIVLQK